MKVRLIQFLVRLLVKLETKEVLLDRVVSVLYPGKLGYLMLASPEEFAGRLKQGGYYEDTPSNYAAGMQRWEGKYAAGTSGSTVQSDTNIGSVNITITQPNASPKEIQDSVARGIAQHTNRQVQRNLNELSGVYA